MTREEYFKAIDEASTYAGQGDDKWNERYVDALGARGLVLHFGELDDIGFYILAPRPFPAGWRFEDFYPTYIVRRGPP